MNTATIDEHEHAVESRADAALDRLAQLHHATRDEAAQWREGVVHAVDRPRWMAVVTVAQRRRVTTPKRGLLALHVAAGLRWLAAWSLRAAADPRSAPRLGQA